MILQEQFEQYSYKPLTYKVIGTTSFAIFYQEDIIGALNSDESVIKDVVNMLNVAFHMGYSTAELDK